MAEEKKAVDLGATDCSPEKSVDVPAEEEAGSTQSRRQFLLKAGVGLAAVTAAAVMPSQVLGATLSQQEVQAMAGKIVANVGALSFNCSPTESFCDLDKNLCHQSICPSNYCPDNYNGSCHDAGDFCPAGFCDAYYCANGNTCYGPWTHDDCTDSHCPNDFCANSYCHTNNGCPQNHCKRGYCPADFCHNGNESTGCTLDDCPGGYVC